jgi:hypothetical protein
MPQKTPAPSVSVPGVSADTLNTIARLLDEAVILSPIFSSATAEEVRLFVAALRSVAA